MSIRYLYIFCLLFALSACNKDEEVNTCEDGLLSPGEEGVDCGGPCPPCPEPTPTPFAYAKINDAETQFSNYTLEKYDDWVLNFKNDTIDITINLGDGDSLGARPLKTQFSQGKLYGLTYDVLSQGQSLITNIDHDKKTMSFFFQARFTIDPDSPNYNVFDTLFVREGDFENIPWIE
jgi:hypothetical protein